MSNRKRERREGREWKFTEDEREEIQGRDQKIRKEEKRKEKIKKERKPGRKHKILEEWREEEREKEEKQNGLRKGEIVKEWFADGVKTKMVMRRKESSVFQKKKGILK